MSHFELKIECDNAAFAENPGSEISDILETLQNRIDSNIWTNENDNWPLFDDNGNRVGYAYWVTDSVAGEDG